MSWQIDPDTGEEYWVDDEPIGPEDYADYGGETITIPDRPPRPEVGTPAFMSDASDRAIYDIKQASQSEKYADTDYGKMRAAERESIMIPPMPQPKYAVDESGDTPSPPDDRIFAKLIGYGGRIATQKNPVNQEINDDLSGDWTDEWGNKLEPKQVKDIYDTTNLTEDEVTAKIRREMPQRPSDDKLSQWEKWDKFYKQVKPQIESEATSRAEEAKTRVNNSFYGMMANSDISLMKPSQHAEISSKAAAAYNSTFQHVLDKETSLAQTAFTRELERSERAKEATRKAEELKGWKNVPNYTTGMMERVNTVTGETQATHFPVKPQPEKTMQPPQVLSSLEKAFELFPNVDIGTAYDAYLQYINDGYDSATALRHTIQYMKGNVQSGKMGGSQTQRTKLTPAQAAAELKRRRGQ
jgi:hypothetical protein